ncbi:MAG: alanine dehydrogenase [Candidatus Riflebacteria bacterium]|nr:alanine dehydrogenase [Candidatus Riflebacteria bacterium]
MIIGVPRNRQPHEYRVGLTPLGVSRLAQLGHEVYVEHDAGAGSRFSDEDYHAAGASIAYDSDEVYQRPDLICAVGSLSADEVAQLRSGVTVCGFMHLAVSPAERVNELERKHISMIGYEIIEDDTGARPVLTALSEIAGQMAVHAAAHLLLSESGGRGMILGGGPGIPPATVVILGAGTVGCTAAAMALACGAHVVLMDTDLGRLRQARAMLPSGAVTAVASSGQISWFAAVADVLIGAVLIPGGRAPYLVTEDMVRRMRPGSVILDLSIDQGGCVETSRPTTPDRPTFKVHEVTHYCVPNMTANAPRTASRALTLAAMEYLTRMAEDGVDAALRTTPGLAAGVYLYQGRMVNGPAGRALGITSMALEDLLVERSASGEVQA